MTNRVRIVEPVVEQHPRTQAAGGAEMAFDQATQQELVGLSQVPDRFIDTFLLISGRQHRLELAHRLVALAREVAELVEHIGDAARHAGGKISAGRAEHDDRALRHVFAAVIAGALDDRGRTRVAHRESLACDAIEKASPAIAP